MFYIINDGCDSSPSRLCDEKKQSLFLIRFFVVNAKNLMSFNVHIDWYSPGSQKSGQAINAYRCHFLNGNFVGTGVAGASVLYCLNVQPAMTDSMSDRRRV